MSAPKHPRKWRALPESERAFRAERGQAKALQRRKSATPQSLTGMIDPATGKPYISKAVRRRLSGALTP